MTWLRALWHGVGRAFARRTPDVDFDEEVRNHLAMLTERFVRQGMTPDAATAAARRQFGNVRIVKDDRRDLMGGVALEAWISDLRLAVRALRRSSGFAVTAILLLALGIGANTAIFSVLDEVLIRPLPVQRPRELALVRLAISPRATFQGAARLGFVSVREFLGPNAGIPFPVFDTLRRTNQVFSGVLAEGPRTTVELRAARESGDAGLAHAAFVSGNYFSVLGLAPAAGRLFVDADDDRARGVGVVISHRYWERHFGRDPNVASARPASGLSGAATSPRRMR